MVDNAAAKRIFVDQSKCLGCKTCELRCAVERNSVSKVLTEAVHEEILPRPRIYVEWDGTEPLAIQCRHCEDAPCLEICSTGALQRDPESGVVFVDVNKCIACWMCVMVCPYGVIAPAVEKHAADKCDQCFQMAEPICVAACPTGALLELTPAEFALRIKERREKGLARVQENLSEEGNKGGES
ncbi:MAG TPA: 4Fe-4S dicluster domain-containing protein [Desulfitobacteriaceae bacterium]|nr:4Fe-4S dicluster domain-containing protein [Desulfitobacteriaceae bacterium]